MPVKPLFNDRLLDELIQYIEVGNYVPTACAAVGIGESTYYRWLSDGQGVEHLLQGRDNVEELKERMRDGEMVLGMSEVQIRSWMVRERIQTASAKSEAFAVAMVRKHMPDQWTAAMTFLERRFPGRWKRKEQIDIGDAETITTGIDESLLLQDPEAVKLVHDALERAAKGELTITSSAVEVDDDERPAD